MTVMVMVLVIMRTAMMIMTALQIEMKPLQVLIPWIPLASLPIGITISFLIALSQDSVQILVTLIQTTTGLSMEKMTSQPIQIIPPIPMATGFLIRPIPMMIMTG